MPKRKVKYENFDIIKKEYERLFGEYFNNLDFEKDVSLVERYESRKRDIYENKGIILAHFIEFTLEDSLDYRNRVAKK